MKKILALLTMAPLALSAKAYVGAQVGASFLDAQARVKGTDRVSLTATTTAPYNFSNDVSVKKTAFNFGALAGWSFMEKSTFSPFAEIDYSYSGSKKARTNLDYYDDANNSNNFMRNERISVKQKHSFGFMPGVDVKVTDKLSALMGVRLSMTQYEVKAEHVNSATAANFAGQVDPLNSSTKKAFVMGVEPTIGAKFAFTEKLSARFTVGYLISQKKTIIKNYIGAATPAGRGDNASVAIKPRGVRVNAAVIYSF